MRFSSLLFRLISRTALVYWLLGWLTVNAADTAYHFRLIDRLDRPADGYCLDILGVGNNLRVDLPLFAHNCKPFLTNDSAVQMTSSGQILFPAVARCLTVAGVNSRAVRGASVLLRPCDERGPFFETTDLQRFVFESDGQVRLANSELCLAVGTESDSTYSPLDRWRALYVDSCEQLDTSRSRWELVVPE